MAASSRQLAIPRSGSGVIELGKEARDGITIAAWQTPEKGTPKRCVVRVDGLIKDNAATNNPDGSIATYGFPCAVLLIRYTTGGFVREVMVDAVTQSALTVWAESIDVTITFDKRRIARLLKQTAPVTPCLAQMLASAISGCECGDTGAADARYLDVLAVDSDDGTSETVILPVPNGARAVRDMATIIAGVQTDWSSLLTRAYFTCNPPAAGLVGFIGLAGIIDPSLATVPVNSKFLILVFPTGTIATFDVPTFVEWIMAPATMSPI